MRGDGSGGLFLLLTESFAVRALLGSLVACGLVYIAARMSDLRTGRARRLLILAPITAVVAAALLSVGEAFLPRLWVATTSSGSAAQLLDYLGESWFLTPQREIDVLMIVWAAVAAVLLLRRFAGGLATRRLLTRASPPTGYGDLVPLVDRLARTMQIRSPELLLLPQCPGGAFTARTLRPVVVVDPAVIDTLDQREVEGLLAHELAHVRRRDNLVAGAAGVFRDLTFFLPPVHAAVGWLRREREESADQLACQHTMRPGALASSILKVWESGATARRAVTCAAVPARGVGLSARGQVVEQRVERLITVREGLSRWRHRAEFGLAAAVTAVAVGAALAVPSWMVAQYDAAGLAVGYLTPAPAAGPSPDAPAFATFKELAPTPDQARATTASAETEGGQQPAGECLCVPTRAELRDGVLDRPGRGGSAMAWRGDDMESWELRSVQEGSRARDARPLWTVSDPGQHVGFFVLGAAPQMQ